MDLLNFAKENYADILLICASLVAAAEVFVRLTPTKKDDSAVERIGGYLRKAMDFFKVPNVKKKE